MLTVDHVKDALGIPPADAGDDAWLAAVVDAVNAWVAGLPILADRPAPTAPWPPSVTLGATMLAVHQYQSRSAPYGRATLDVAGGFQTAYADPEIARLLALRRWAKPTVGGAPGPVAVAAPDPEPLP